ncbi:hypothetical protein I3700191H1_12670 [Megasphaera massiliensis]
MGIMAAKIPKGFRRLIRGIYGEHRDQSLRREEFDKKRRKTYT